MMQIVKQTKEEKIKMYMKCPKKQLAEMLWSCNVIIDSLTPKVKTSQIKQSNRKSVVRQNRTTQNFSCTQIVDD